MILESVITCPHCGTAKLETMPTDACQFLYDCTGCGARLWAKPGDCCVFCSYGTMPCPPIQAARAGETAASCCTGTADSGSQLDALVPEKGKSNAKRLHYIHFCFRILRRSIHRRVAAKKRRLAHRTRNRSQVAAGVRHRQRSAHVRD